MFIADLSNIRHGGIDVSSRVALTIKKTLINYKPEEGRYGDRVVILYLSVATASASLGSVNGDSG